MNIDVKETREKIDAMGKIATARGRRERAGLQINTEDKTVKAEHARLRADGFLRVRNHLRRMVEDASYGISTDELESVEFICEQLDELSKAVWIEAVKAE